MKSLNEFRELYDTELTFLIEPFEQKRKRFLRSFFLGIGITVLLAGSCLLFLSNLPVIKYLIATVIGIAGFRIFRKKRDDFRSGFTKEFKSQIIARLVALVDKSLKYHPESGFPEEVYTQSGIIRGRVDWYKSEDYFEGSVGGVPICFAEVHAKTRENDHQTGQETYYDLFRGLLFAADFNKNFSSRLIILPDIFNGNIFGVGEKLARQLAPPKAEIIKLEDPEFEKYFAVFGFDQVEARYILSTSLMHRILEFRKKHKALVISFADNRVYIGIMWNKNLFEPRIFRKAANREILEHYFHFIELAAGITTDLNILPQMHVQQIRSVAH